MKTTVARKEHFNAAHRLDIPDLSEAENHRIFGKCNHPNFHGHNYDLIVRITGETDPVTGYVIDMKTLSELIRTRITDDFDHKNLNLNVVEFKSLIPTAENIALVIYNRLRPSIDHKLELKIQLYETERNFVEYPA